MKKHTITFKFKGKTIKKTLIFTDIDEWYSFKSQGFAFDAHYCEDYESLDIYEVVNGKVKNKPIFTKKIIICEDIAVLDYITGEVSVYKSVPFDTSNLDFAEEWLTKNTKHLIGNMMIMSAFDIKVNVIDVKKKVCAKRK